MAQNSTSIFCNRPAHLSHIDHGSWILTLLWENTAGPKVVSRAKSCRCMTTGLSSFTWALAQLKLASRCPGSRGDLRWAAAVRFSPEPLLAEPSAEDLEDLLTP